MDYKSLNIYCILRKYRHTNDSLWVSTRRECGPLYSRMFQKKAIKDSYFEGRAGCSFCTLWLPWARAELSVEQPSAIDRQGKPSDSEHRVSGEDRRSTLCWLEQ